MPAITDEPVLEQLLSRATLELLQRWLTRGEILAIVLQELFTVEQIKELLKARIAGHEHNPPPPLSADWLTIQRGTQAVQDALARRHRAWNLLPHVQVNPVGRHVDYWTPEQGW